MPNHITLINSFERIEHSYADFEFFSLMISAAGYVGKRSTDDDTFHWKNVCPWLWGQVKPTIKFGCFEDNFADLSFISLTPADQGASPDPLELVPLQLKHPISDHSSSLLNRALNKRRDHRYNDNSQIPLIEYSDIPSAANGNKRFQEFVINEANRPIHVAEALNLNICFKIKRNTLTNFINRLQADGIDTTKIQFCAFAEFTPYDTLLQGTCVSGELYGRQIGKIIFAPTTGPDNCEYNAIVNTQPVQNIASENRRYRPWLQLRVHNEDWITSLDSHLKTLVNPLESILSFISDSPSSIANLRNDLLDQINLMLCQCHGYTSLSDNKFIRPLSLKGLQDDTPEDLTRLTRLATEAIELYEKDLGVQNANEIVTEVAGLIKTAMPQTDSTVHDTAFLNNLRSFCTTMTSPQAISYLLQQIFHKATAGLAEYVEINKRMSIANEGDITRLDYKGQNQRACIKSIIANIETVRGQAEHDATQLRQALAEAIVPHARLLLSRYLPDALKDMANNFVSSQIIDYLSDLLPDSTALNESPIPRKAVQPIVLDVGASVVSPSATMKPADITGFGILLREKKEPGIEWKCLNLASIKITDNPADALISRELIPIKLTKQNGLLRCSVNYSNQPLSSSNAFTRMSKAVGVKGTSSSEPIIDYIQYDLAKQDNDAVYQVPMLKYGATYETAAFVVDKAGAVPQSLRDTESEHPGDIRGVFDADTIVENIETLKYLREVGFGKPRLSETLPVIAEGVRTIDSEFHGINIAIPADPSTCRDQSVTSRVIFGNGAFRTEAQGIQFSNSETPSKLDFAFVRESDKLTVFSVTAITKRKLLLSIGSSSVETQTAYDIHTIAIETVEISENSFAIKVYVNDSKTPVTFDGKENVACSEKPLDAFRIKLSAQRERAENNELLSINKITYSPDNDASELFKSTENQLLLLYPDKWNTTPKVTESRTLVVFPPSTTFDNWDRWFVPSDEFLSDPDTGAKKRQHVVSEYFKSMLAKSAGTKEGNIDAFEFNDPACDSVGYAELVKVYPIVSPSESLHTLWFKYGTSNDQVAKAIDTKKLICKTTQGPSGFSFVTNPKNPELNISIPAGELWELRLFPAVQAADLIDKCHSFLSRNKTLKSNITGTEVLYHLFEPFTLRIESASGLPFENDKPERWTSEFLKSMKNAIEVKEENSKVLVFADAGKLKSQEEGTSHLISEVNIHWQTFQWDGRPLAPFPYREDVYIESQPEEVNAAAYEQKLREWEATAFANRPETEHFTETSRFTIHDSKIEVLRDDLNGSTKADVYRMAFTHRSRYYALNNQLKLSTFELLQMRDAQNVGSCWQRYFVKCRWAGEIPAPLVKCIIPLTRKYAPSKASASKKSTLNPDLLVILNEPPFRIGGLAEQIIPEVCTAGIDHQYLEIGPDPILTSPKAELVSKVWSEDTVKTIGRRQIGFFKDLGSDYPRFTASALVLPSPEPLDSQTSDTQFDWYMMKLTFRRVLDKNGTKLATQENDPQEYSSKASPPTWIQILPNSRISDDFTVESLLLLNKGFTSSLNSELVLTPANAAWNYANIDKKSVFSYCLLITEQVVEADGLTPTERYHSIFRFESENSPVLFPADPQSKTDLAALPKNGYARLLEIQSRKSLAEMLKNKSLWDVLYRSEDDQDAYARISRQSQPMKYSKPD